MSKSKYEISKNEELSLSSPVSFFNSQNANYLTKPQIRQALDNIIECYQQDYNGEASNLLANLPPEEYWRFFIDEQKQNTESGWVGFEAREPGYLYAMLQGFEMIFDRVEDLNQFIKKLHFTIANEVELKHYEINSSESKGYYRTNGICCTISDGNSSRNGLSEILELIKIGSRNNILPFLEIKNETEGKERQYISSDSVNNRLLSNLEQHIKTGVMEFVFSHYPLLNDEAFVPYGLLFRERIEEEMQRLILEYNHSLARAANYYDKLKCILRFIQCAERLHPFIDCNTRLFSMLLKNHLLKENGFPLIFSDPNPNRIVGYSLDELVEINIGLMRTTLDIVQKRKLYGIETKEIIAGLDPTQKSYFEKVLDKAYEISGELQKNQSINLGSG